MVLSRQFIVGLVPDFSVAPRTAPRPHRQNNAVDRYFPRKRAFPEAGADFDDARIIERSFQESPNSDWLSGQVRPD